MNLNQLEESDKIAFSTITGSHAYGLNIETSDIDMTGIFLYNKEEMLKFDELPSQISDAKSDIKYYGLKEFFRLMLKSSPNMIEMLYIDEKFHKIKSDLVNELIAKRDMFISQKCYYSFVNYAYAQIKKSKGRNKWINNPKPKEKPVQLDYMYWIPSIFLSYAKDKTSEVFPCRPIKFVPENIKKVKVSKIEHGFNSFRMYSTEGHDFLKSGTIECSSISKEEERTQFIGILNFNEIQYKQDCSDWKNYWGWIKERNESRWVKQESGELDYDSKNMMHCFRLLMSAFNILTKGVPMVMMNPSQRKVLLEIREGKFTHDDLLKRAAQLNEKIEEAKKALEESDNPIIPKEVNREQIVKFYEELSNKYC